MNMEIKSKSIIKHNLDYLKLKVFESGDYFDATGMIMAIIEYKDL